MIFYKVYLFQAELPQLRPKPAVPGRPTVLKRNSMLEKGTKGGLPARTMTTYVPSGTSVDDHALGMTSGANTSNNLLTEVVNEKSEEETKDTKDDEIADGEGLILLTWVMVDKAESG